jgi:hypothetical protein
MSNEVLMQFLKKGLIDLKGSDEKLEKLVSASSALANNLEEMPSKALSYALIALDPKAPEDDPVVQEALCVLEKNWTTYFNTFSGTPIQVIRALLLQALINESEKNQRVAIAFISITRNILPHLEVGNEHDMWADLVGNIEQKLNAQAEAEWATPEKITVEPFSYTPPKLIELSSKDVTLDRASLQSGIDKASGPNNTQGQVTNGNAFWPNSGQGWVNQFTPLITTTIADVVDAALAKAQMEPVDLSEPLKELSVAVATHIDSTLSAVSRATVGLQRRTSLIWWKESLYSLSACCSYRQMPPAVAAAVMAFDLFKQVPTCSPASVSAFLYESVLSLQAVEKAKQTGLAQLVKEIQQSQYADSLCKYLDSIFTEVQGRGPLLRLLRSHSISPDEARFHELTGIASKTKLSNSEWAAWVFRELQAVRAVASGASADD